jgi:hypothetical protein
LWSTLLIPHHNVKKIRNRKKSFEIQRGYYDVDEIEIKLPADFKIESLPVDFEINSKFEITKHNLARKMLIQLVTNALYGSKKVFILIKSMMNIVCSWNRFQEMNAKIILTPITTMNFKTFSILF